MQSFPEKDSDMAQFGCEGQPLGQLTCSGPQGWGCVAYMTAGGVTWDCGTDNRNKLA